MKHVTVGDVAVLPSNTEASDKSQLRTEKSTRRAGEVVSKHLQTILGATHTHIWQCLVIFLGYIQ